MLTGSPSAAEPPPEFDQDMWKLPASVVIQQYMHYPPPKAQLGEFNGDSVRVEFALADFIAQLYYKLPPAVLEWVDRDTQAEAYLVRAGSGSFVPWMKDAPNVQWMIKYIRHDAVQVWVTFHPGSDGKVDGIKRASGLDGIKTVDPSKIGIASAKAEQFGGAGWRGHPSTVKYIPECCADGVLYNKPPGLPPGIGVADRQGRIPGSSGDPHPADNAPRAAGSNTDDITRASGGATRDRPQPAYDTRPRGWNYAGDQRWDSRASGTDTDNSQRWNNKDDWWWGSSSWTWRDNKSGKHGR